MWQMSRSEIEGLFWIRKTRTEEYWQQPSISEGDLEGLYDLFIEQGLPQTVEALASWIVEGRCREEDERYEREQALRPIFQPQETYEVGRQLTFPSEEGAVGEVVEVRPGNNPTFGEFSVIVVEFPDGDINKQFASGLSAHPSLAIRTEEGLEEVPSVEETIAQYGPLVAEQLEGYLQESEDFASFLGEWLPIELLAEIHIGHLNLCEALIEMSGGPMTAEEMVDTLELSEGIDPKAQAFSLNVALSKDDRFAQVGQRGDQPLWYLPRLGPPSEEEG
jgi:hypothetical protein